MISARFGLVLVGLLPGTIAAQRGDAFSLVGAVVGVEPGGRDFSGTTGGIGYDLQVRFAASGSRTSVGAGVNSTTHLFSSLVVRGTFVELRVAVGPDSAGIGPYLTARLSRLHQRFGSFPGPGAALGAGAGAVLDVAPRFQLDGSATIGHVWLPSLNDRGVIVTVRIGAAVRIG